MATDQSTGLSRIIDERVRQVERGHTLAHDLTHTDMELIKAAECYLRDARYLTAGHPGMPAGHKPHAWPWRAADWTPGADPVDSLVKAAALIAAEIDRQLNVRLLTTEA